MNIGIIGSGIVGRTLGAAFIKEGHAVMLGSRTPSKEEVVTWQQENVGSDTGTFAQAASFGELLVLAVAGFATEKAIQLAGVENFAGKIVIDTTNPVQAAPPVKGVLQFFTSLETSLMEQTQQLLPHGKLVKAFNSTGHALMYQPGFTQGPPSMFICGNDAMAKKTVTGLLDDFGWQAEDMGAVESARAIEPLCILWCIPGFIRDEWSHAFKLLKK